MNFLSFFSVCSFNESSVRSRGVCAVVAAAAAAVRSSHGAADGNGSESSSKTTTKIAERPEEHRQYRQDALSLPDANATAGAATGLSRDITCGLSACPVRYRAAAAAAAAAAPRFRRIIVAT